MRQFSRKFGRLTDAVDNFVEQVAAVLQHAFPLPLAMTKGAFRSSVRIRFTANWRSLRCDSAGHGFMEGSPRVETSRQNLPPPYYPICSKKFFQAASSARNHDCCNIRGRNTLRQRGRWCSDTYAYGYV